MSKHVSKKGVEEAVDHIMSEIDDLGGAEYMSKQQYIEFNEEIASRCKANADAMKEELRDG